MSEARKFHLNLIVANQFTTQLTEEIRDAVFGNIGTVVSFRVGQNDVDALSRYFQPQFDGDDLLRVPNYNAIVRSLVNGVPTQPFSMATLPPLGNPNPGLADALKQLSAAKYGKPRAVVEKTIFDRLATQTPAPKPFQGAFGATPGAPAPTRPTMGAIPAASAPGGTPSGSFLDEWLAKQRATAPTPQMSAARSPMPLAPPAPAAQERPVQYLNTSAPAAPPAAGQPSLNVGAGEGNVSSAQLDKQEIDDIAKELKKDLKPGAQAAPSTETAAPADASPTEGTVHFKPKADATADDTIFIDTEGHLQLREPAAESAPKE
jgi:hypothetical protein